MGVRALTDRTWYAPGDEFRVRLENRSGRHVQYPEASQHLQFFRRVGQEWVLQPDPQAGSTENAPYYALDPCHSREVMGVIFPQFPEGEYRIGFYGAWTTNTFVIVSKRALPSGAEPRSP